MSPDDKWILVASIVELAEHITRLVEDGQMNAAREANKTLRERVERLENA